MLLAGLATDEADVEAAEEIGLSGAVTEVAAEVEGTGSNGGEPVVMRKIE